MWQQNTALVLQTLIVLAAFAALFVSMALARGDRREAAAQAQLRWELEMLVRLSVNLEGPGSSNTAESKRLGAERGALLNAFGSERLPLSWETYRGVTLADAHAFIAATEGDPEAQWRRCANEVAIELDRTRRAGTSGVMARHRGA